MAGAGVDLAAVEDAVRASMTGIGRILLDRLLSADSGYLGPRIDCGQEHSARFVGYRSKTVTTALGQVRLRRAYYHCGDCARGIIPRDTQLGIDGVSLSPGLGVSDGLCKRQG